MLRIWEYNHSEVALSGRDKPRQIQPPLTITNNGSGPKKPVQMIAFTDSFHHRHRSAHQQHQNGSIKFRCRLEGLAVAKKVKHRHDKQFFGLLSIQKHKRCELRCIAERATARSRMTVAHGPMLRPRRMLPIGQNGTVDEPDNPWLASTKFAQCLMLVLN